MPAPEITLDEFFSGHPQGRPFLAAVEALIAAQGPCRRRVTRSQVAWRRRRGFAYLWLPGRWLRRTASEVVLTIALPGRDPSPRWKEVVEPAPGVWMHHLELATLAGVDAEVAGWLAAAYEAAG